jgi:hypothetical protein
VALVLRAGHCQRTAGCTGVSMHAIDQIGARRLHGGVEWQAGQAEHGASTPRRGGGVRALPLLGDERWRLRGRPRPLRARAARLRHRRHEVCEAAQDRSSRSSEVSH